jgi:UDP-N-acetylmuramoylalanine--D-glutamate ligase
MQPVTCQIELSSFQLEIMTRSPHIAAVLNITPNHLDRHKTMGAYTAAKAHILQHQTKEPGDFECAVVLGYEDPGAWTLHNQATAPVWTFGRQRVEGYPGTYLAGEMLCFFDGQNQVELMPRNSINLRGDHNLLNVLAACAVAAAVGLPVSAMRLAVEDFYGVAHRLEFVRQWGGAAWYNDHRHGLERTMAALRSFTEPIVLPPARTRICLEEFARLVSERVDHLVLFGEAVEKILAAIGSPAPGERPYSIACCENLSEAVQAAASVVEPGDVVLLSPGGTSYDEFRDFEARGEAYRQWVLEL